MPIASVPLPDRWWFLTGPKATIYDLIQDRLKLRLMEAAPADPETGTEAIVHSDRLALLDRGRVVGFFDSNDPKDVDTLVARARRRALPGWVRLLPTVNASLNALSAALLLAGWILIRRYRIASAHPDAPTSSAGSIWNHPLVKAHITCMVSAVGTSTLFLACYLLYHYHAGSYPFPQGGLLRVVYLAILLSHTVLATASVPLIVMTVLRGWRGNLAGHARFATVDFPDLDVCRHHRRRHLSDALPPAGPESDRRCDVLTQVRISRQRPRTLRKRIEACSLWVMAFVGLRGYPVQSGCLSPVPT